MIRVHEDLFSDSPERGYSLMWDDETGSSTLTVTAPFMETISMKDVIFRLPMARPLFDAALEKNNIAYSDDHDKAWEDIISTSAKPFDSKE